MCKFGLRKFLGLGLVACLILATSLGAQDDRQQRRIRGAAGPSQAALQRHVKAIEQSAAIPLDELVQKFDAAHWSAAMLKNTTATERESLLKSMQTAAKNFGGIMVSHKGDAIELTLIGPKEHTIRFALEPAEPFAIEWLEVKERVDNEPKLELNEANLAESFEQLASEGFSTVVYIRRDGQVLLNQAFGRVNPAADQPMQLDTAFCIGSVPIDFTIAAIQLLHARGKLSLDDSLPKFFPNVPDDKQAMTIQHLLTGRSGLPNFHHTDADSDHDLAWIDRSEAERRILGQQLLFAPGESEAHSHSAFVLLSAVIERVSGQSYIDFLRENFFLPAGMSRTGLYGEFHDIPVAEFAVGGGPNRVGDPNIPPNWGKTSWLVMGSGGMFSTAEDLLKFYEFTRKSEFPKLAKLFAGSGIGVGGSDRGYYVLHVYNGTSDEALLFTNVSVQDRRLRKVTRAVEQFMISSTKDLP